LKLCTFEVEELPPILCLITSRVLESIHLFIRERIDGHQRLPEDSGNWALLDRELCDLAERLQSGKSFNRASLEVRLVPEPTAVGFELAKVVKGFLPGSQKHRYISLT